LRYSGVCGLLRYLAAGALVQRPADEAHHLLTGGVPDREHQPVAEPVDDAAPPGGQRHPGIEQLGVGAAGGAQVLDQGAPAGWGVTQLEASNGLTRDGPLAEQGQDLPGVRAPGEQLGGVESAGAFVQTYQHLKLGLEHVFDVWMSPGSVTEQLHFYAAPYTPASRTGPGGGLPDDGEDIDVLELPFDQALDQIATGHIADAKTVMLLQWAALHGPFRRG